MQISQRFTFILLWMTIFTIPWQKSFVIGGLGSINKFIGIFLFITATYVILLRMKVTKPPHIFIIVYLFIFWNCLSWFWSLDQNGSIQKNILLIQLAFLAYIIYEFSKTTSHVYSLFQAYVLGCSISCIISIYDYLNTPLDEYQTRFFAEGYNPNDIGYTLALAMPIAWFLGLHRSKLYLIYIPATLFAILLTGSRSAFVVTLFITISIMWFALRHRVKYGKLILFLLIIPLCWIAYKEVPQGTIERLLSTQNEISTGTLSARTIIWRAGFSVFKNYPFQGVGSGAYGAATIDLTGLGQANNAHNAFISVLVENGIVGITIFLGISINIFMLSWRLRDHPNVRWLFLTLCISWFIISIGDHNEAQKYTWIMFAFIITLSHLLEDVQTAANPETEKLKAIPILLR